MKKKLLLVSALLGTLVLTGCQTPTRYAWHDYNSTMYQYNDGKLSEADAIALIAKVEEEAASSKRLVAPGVYSDIGTLYVRMGDNQKAVEYYRKEMETWPESAPLMSKLIEGLSRWKKDDDHAKVEGEHEGDRS